MYARHKIRRLTGTRTEAEFLGELQTILLQSTSDSLGGVRGLYCRVRDLSKKVALYFCCEGRSVLLRTEGAFHVSIHRCDTAWSGHLELEIGVVRDFIEASERGSSE